MVQFPIGTKVFSPKHSDRNWGPCSFVLGVEVKKLWSYTFHFPVRLRGVLGYSFTLLYLLSDSYLTADAWKIVYSNKLFYFANWPTLTNPGCKILFRDVGYDKFTGGQDLARTLSTQKREQRRSE